MLNARDSTIAARAWDPHFCDRSPMFEPLREAAERLRGPHWPGIDKLQRLAAEAPALLVQSGLPLSVVRQDKSWSIGFEARAYLHGELQVRASSWHDLLNVLAWRVFPAGKAALNRAHYEALPEGADGRRGARRDALTLFDESGVIVAAADPELLEMIRRFQWHELFWTQRARVRDSVRCYVFGHALYEKALAPYVGLTGHALLLDVERAFFGAPLAAQVEALDPKVAERVADAAFDASALAPLPVLGVPGWWPDNEDEAFYCNERYFRGGRTRASAGKR